ncbi:MAG: hypothetical protein ACTS6O_07190 [Giesbergeria sp.]
MSSRCMAAVFERYPAGGGEFALALALADNAHDDGTHIFPSVSTMAAKSRQSVRAVQVQLVNMRAKGWLWRVRSGGGRGVVAEYRINPDWLKGADLSPFPAPVDNSPKGELSAPFGAIKGADRGMKRVQIDAQKGAVCDTTYITSRTSIEPNTPLPPATGGAEGFEEFASEYPRQVAMSQARKVWDALAPDAALRKRMLMAVRTWTQSPEWQRNAGQFIPKATRWLREERWNDVPGVSIASTPTVPQTTLAPVAPLTPEQLAANGAKARAAAALARQTLGQHAAPREHRARSLSQIVGEAFA